MTVQVRGFALACMSVLVLALAACGGPSDGPGGGQPTPPAAPTDVTATAGAGFVTVTWEHDGAGVTGFVISRATVQAATVQAVTVVASAQQPSMAEEADRVSPDAERVHTAASVGEVGANERSFRDNAVVAGRAYRYSVVAMGSGGVASEAGVQTAPPVVPAEPDALACELAWEAAVARGAVRSLRARWGSRRRCRLRTVAHGGAMERSYGCLGVARRRSGRRVSARRRVLGRR